MHHGDLCILWHNSNSIPETYHKSLYEKVIDYMHKYYREHAEAKKDYRRMRYEEQRQDEEFMKKNRERCRIYREKKRRQEA
jgi:hypothetical protein